MGGLNSPGPVRQGSRGHGGPGASLAGPQLARPPAHSLSDSGRTQPTKHTYSRNQKDTLNWRYYYFPAFASRIKKKKKEFVIKLLKTLCCSVSQRFLPASRWRLRLRGSAQQRGTQGAPWRRDKGLCTRGRGGSQVPAVGGSQDTQAASPVGHEVCGGQGSFGARALEGVRGRGGRRRRRRWSLRMKLLPHTVQVKGRTPVCVR